MKKSKTLFNILLSFFLVIVGFVSCKDNSNQADNQNSNKNYSELTRFRGSLSNLNLKDQKHIFNSLPNDVKYALWEDRFISRMENAGNEKEKAVLKKIIEHFSKNIYNDSLAKIDFQNYIQQSFTETYEAFGKDSARLHTLFFRLGDNNAVAPLFTKGGLPDCDCNVKKDWCILSSCVRGNCDSSSYGCGPSWIWECNGTCQ